MHPPGESLSGQGLHDDWEAGGIVPPARTPLSLTFRDMGVQDGSSCSGRFGTIPVERQNNEGMLLLKAIRMPKQAKTGKGRPMGLSVRDGLPGTLEACHLPLQLLSPVDRNGTSGESRDVRGAGV